MKNPVKITFRFIHGDTENWQRNQTIVLRFNEAGEAWIGRDRYSLSEEGDQTELVNKLAIVNGKISRTHICLMAENNEMMVQDYGNDGRGSTNGSHICPAGKLWQGMNPYKRYVVHVGDQIILAKCVVLEIMKIEMNV